MRSPEGEDHIVTGSYREFEPPSRLVFTWAWQSAPEAETLVTVEFRDADEGSALTLTHEQFASEESRAQHEHGWSGCLDNLEQLLS
jgi:uncharacterized protein YndB with AHSA1/START domain